MISAFQQSQNFETSRKFWGVWEVLNAEISEFFVNSWIKGGRTTPMGYY